MARSTKQRKRDSRREEAKTAERLGGRLTFNSGTGVEKADGRVRGVYRIENKITDSPSYRITGAEWSMLWRIAVMAGEEPIFHVRLPVLRTAYYTRLVILAKHFAAMLLDEAVSPPLNRGGEAGAKGYALSTQRWMKLGEDTGHIHLVLIDHKRVRKPVVVMRWERFCQLTGHTE